MPVRAFAVVLVGLLVATAFAGCVKPSLLPIGGLAPRMPRETSALGVVAEVAPVAAGHRFVVNAEAVDCERAHRSWTIEARVPNGTTLPSPGEPAALHFHERDGAWTMGRYVWDPTEVPLADPRAAYARACANAHASDVAVDHAAATGRGGTAVRVASLAVALGDTTVVHVPLANRQDVPLAARLSSVVLANERAALWTGPPMETPPSEDARARAAAVRGCDVEAPADAFEIAPGSRVEIALRVTCGEDAETQPLVRDCGDLWARPAPPGGEASEPAPDASCRDVVASPLAMLWGRLAFRDELGFFHERNVTLRQFLHPALASRLVVDAPERIDRRDAFVVRARFVDAAGAAIPDASLVLALDHPGLEDRAFGMRWDAEAGEHVLVWADFAEWRPLRWHAGDHAVTVDATDGRGAHASASARVVVRFE